MPKTFNRLSQFNALESTERLSGIQIPLLKNDIEGSSDWVLRAKDDEDTTSPNVLDVKISSGNRVPEVGDPIVISGIAKNETRITYSDVTTTASTFIISGLTGMTSENIGYSVSGNGIPVGSVITEVLSLTSIEIDQACTVTSSTAEVYIGPNFFLEGNPELITVDPDVVLLNGKYNIIKVEEVSEEIIITVPVDYIFNKLNSDPASITEIYSYGNESYSTAFPYPSKWNVSNVKSFEVVSDFFETKKKYSLKITPLNSNPINISLIGFNEMLIGDNGKDFSFNGKIFCSETTTVSCSLYVASDGPQPEPATTIVYPGKFTAFRSNIEELPISDEEKHSLNINITISEHGSQPFYITSPNLIEDFLYYSNPYVYSARYSMPDFYWDIDSNQTNPSAPLHRLIDCLTTGARDVYEEYLRIYHYEPGQLGRLAEQYETNNTHSTLVNPKYVETKYASWLSQFNGHILKRNIPYSFDGVSEESFETLQPLFSADGPTEDFIKWQLSTGYYGMKSGTTEALREATKQVLHYTKDGEESTYFVSIIKHYLNDPFKILILTKLNETFDCSEDGQESAAILDAVEMAKPMGYKIYHIAVEEVVFRIGDELDDTEKPLQ
jgi:hypothetical protein